jgi:hypothetical protein
MNIIFIKKNEKEYFLMEIGRLKQEILNEKNENGALAQKQYIFFF